MNLSNVRLLPFLVLILLAGACVGQGGGASSTEPAAEIREGFIVERVTMAGTLSESRVFVLSRSRDASFGGIILFDAESLKSYGFDAFVGQYVRVEGSPGEGSVGWQGERESGFLVKDITPVSPRE